jgi:Zn-dependent protease/CBS domain-containing protein
MVWSVKIGKLFGIQLKIHLTCFLLLFLIYIAGASQFPRSRAIAGVFFISVVFLSVLIHEFGHSLMAKKFGSNVRDITLLPIGGISSMEEMPEKPTQEIVMTVIGPMINLVIAGVLYISLGWWSGISYPTLYPDSARSFVSSLITVNLILAAFNLIPAFPMDGGRTLRGILALKMDYLRATSIAVAIGQFLSIVFIFYGFLYNFWLTLIGVFLFIGAGSEKNQTVFRFLLQGVRSEEAMTTAFKTVASGENLSDIMERVYHSGQDDFPVVDGEELRGILTRDRVVAAINEKGEETAVSSIMEKDFTTVTPNTNLNEVYHILKGRGKTVAAVIEDGQLKGMISLEGLTRFFTIQNILHREHRHKKAS